jgi:hypothetical protein
MENPFIVVGKIKPEYFCDRQEESLRLVRQTTNGANTVIVSPRRLGKTGLIEYCFDKPALKQHYITMFVDILRTSSLNELIYMLGKTVFETIGTRSQRLMKLMVTTLKTLNGHFGYDPVSNTPTFDIRLGDITNPVYTLEEIFACIEQADKRCIIAIDEFQQIGEYTEENVESLLRTKIQRCNRAQFIFSGSKRHVMSNMFNSPSKPFYQSAISMSLDPIPIDTYKQFAISLFDERSKHVETEVIEHVWQQYEGYTWFVQMMMNELYALTPEGGTCKTSMIEDARNNVIMSQEQSYKDLLSNLPPKQKTVLQAIAKEGVAQNITSVKFIKKYNLNSASSVQSAVKLLLKNDLITQSDNRYRVYDFFLSEWLATYY